MITPTHFWLLIVADVILAILIAKYQQRNGYKFINTFIGSLIGLIGLTMLLIKMYREFN
ncbi:MAG: hypothetical protein H6587_08920 [Flavobacteriales bacterium]|nr:hypothetical protein [Flavobacteriales bacterium]MCB9364676.1 hypothetical protein [Flavobacteriales bacterium]